MKLSAKLNLTQLLVDNHIIITKKGDLKSSQDGFLFFSGNKVRDVAEKLQKIAELLEENDRISIELGNSIPYLYDIVFFIRGENVNDWNRKAEFINGYFVYDVDENGKLIAANPTALQLFTNVLGQIEFKKFDVLKQQRNDILSIQKKSEQFLFNESDLCLGINSYNSFDEFHFSVISPKSIQHFLESKEFYKLFEVLKVITNYFRLMIILEKKKKAMVFSVMIITGEQTLNQQILRNDLIRKNISINRDLCFNSLTVYDLLNIIARLPVEQSLHSYELQMKEIHKLKSIYNSLFTFDFENYLLHAQLEFNTKRSFKLSKKMESNSLTIAPESVIIKKEWDKEFEKLSIPPVPDVPKKNVNIQWNTTLDPVKVESISKTALPPKIASHSIVSQMDDIIPSADDSINQITVSAEEYSFFEEDLSLPEPTKPAVQSRPDNDCLATVNRRVEKSPEQGFLLLKDDLLSKFKNQGITLSFQSYYILILPEVQSLFLFVSNDTALMLKKELIKSLLKYKIILFTQEPYNEFTRSCIESIISKKMPSVSLISFSKSNVITSIESKIKEKRSNIGAKAENKKKNMVGLRSENHVVMNKNMIFNE